MRNIITTALMALCISAMLTTSCTKNKEEARLFANRHWQRTTTSTTTCYDSANQQISNNTTESVFDTAFAIGKVGYQEIDFLGFHMSQYEPGSAVDEYIYSVGHGGFHSFSFMLFYDKGKNEIYTTNMGNGGYTIIDSVQHTSCKVVTNIEWRSKG